MADPANTGIYEIVNRVTGKRYVGSAKRVDVRWRQHRRLLRLGKHHSKPLQAAWAKYGEAAFDFILIACCAVDDLLAAEQAVIDQVLPAYNVCLTAGSTLGRAHSAETRAKIAARKIGLKLPPRDDAYRAKMSAAHRGKPKAEAHMQALQEGRSRQHFSESRRQKVSASLKQSYADGRRGRDRPPEYRKKISDALKGRKATPEHRAAQSAAQLGRKRGPYKLDPAKAEERRRAGQKLAAVTNQRRWGAKPASDD